MFDFKIYLAIIIVVVLAGLFFLTKLNSSFKSAFLIITIVINIIYLIWRVTFTIPVSYGSVSIALGIILLIVEATGIFQSIVFKLLFLKKGYNKSSFGTFKKLPTVDVFVATYNEPENILSKTMAACVNINWPKELINIYICDDGRRSEIKKLCEDFGVHYLTRPDNKHAKAGNLNNALKNSTGEFILLLDADMVPKPQILKRTIGYFASPDVGFIQTPQVFYNSDPFQRNLKFEYNIPNEQDFFMREIQAARSKFNAVLHVGTNAVFRREALNAIGGIPTGSITEDMATGMLIQAKGYKTFFVNEILATGLSVENYADLITQRERWCRGNIQVAKKWKPLSIKNLSPMQKLIYFDGTVYWFFGVQKTIYIIFPLLYLLFKIPVFNAMPVDLLLFWLPSYMASVLAFKALSFKNRNLTWSHIYEVAVAPYIAVAAIMELLFSRPLPFKVTPKGVTNNKIRFNYITVIPHIMMALITLAGWLIVLPEFFSSNRVAIETNIVIIFWSLYNFAGIVVSILVAFEQPRLRFSDRITIGDNVRVRVAQDEQALYILKDISGTGLKFECSSNNHKGLKGIIDLSFDGLESIQGLVLRSKKTNGKIIYGVKFKDYSKEEYIKLINFITENDYGYYNKNRRNKKS